MVLWPASTKTTYDNKNGDIDGLTQYIKAFDFANAVFNQPIVNQADIHSKI